MKRAEKDFRELLRLLNKHNVKYCIVGAYAVAFYAIPRYTKDMDILVEPSKENALKVLRALKDFGFVDIGLTADDFNKEGRIIQLGYEPVRIDIVTSIDGCSFNEVWENKVTGKYGDEDVYFIGLEELIKNKSVAKRKQDEIDLEILLSIRKGRNRSR